MFGRLTRYLNSRYMRMIRKVAKWALITAIVALIGVGLSVKLIVPKVTDQLTKNQGVTVIRDADGVPQTLYDGDKIPKDYNQELNVGTPQLIYQNQVRSRDDDREEDASIDLAKISEADRKQLAKATDGFLYAWETFQVGESDRRYRDSLAAHSDLGRLDALTSRTDNIQDPAISRDGQSGQQLDREIRPSQLMRVLRYSGNTAYVSATGEVLYTGPSLTWQGRRVMRAYALVLTRFRDGWRVSRAAAQTQGPIIQ